VPDLCFGCHAAALKDAKGHPLPATKRLFEDKDAQRHPPFALGMCVFCHQPHASANRRLLTQAYPADFYASYSPKAYGLCFGCHAEAAFNEPRTITDTGFRNGNLNLHYRHVNREKGRTCTACHTPHGSRQKKLINQAFRFGNKTLELKYEKTATGGSCVAACHGPIKYDRCKAEEITMRTTSRKGADATPEQLKPSCKADKAEETKKTEEAKGAKGAKDTKGMKEPEKK